MERFLVPVNPSAEKSKSVKRHPWKRTLIELNGKFEPNYRHQLSSLIVQSYSEIGAFPHKYHVNGEPCLTHADWFITGELNNNPSAFRRQGVSSLEFDSKGVYLASVTKSGCLTVHDFDNLQCPDLKEDEAKQLLHVSTYQQLDVVRWNLANQDEDSCSGFGCILNVSHERLRKWHTSKTSSENGALILSGMRFVVVACTSLKSSEVHIFDIGYITSEPVEVLRKRPNITVHGFDFHKGFSDIAFSSDDNSRVLASDTNGVINVWDRRVSDLPCLELTTNSSGSLNSIKLSGDNEIIYGAGKQGTIFMWDLRGGRSYTAFRNHKEEYYSPLTTAKLAHELEKISSLKAQSTIVSKEIHSIDIDPSCPYQLAFHLDDGWSGVLDTNKFQVTHIHCPPPPWLDEPDDLTNVSYLRKPCWLLNNSIYVVGSSSSNGLYLLDFYPDCTSPCHVDYNEDLHSTCEATSQQMKNRHLALSESVTACVSHPRNGTVVAGTKLSSLLVISQ